MASAAWSHMRAIGERARSMLDRLSVGQVQETPVLSRNPSPPESNSRVAYGTRLAVTGITGQFAPASLTAVVELKSPVWP